MPGPDSSLDAPRIIDVPQFRDVRGVLGVIDFADSLPFVPRRFYFLRDVPGGASRGGHAHWIASEAIISLQGGFTVRLDDGNWGQRFRLEVPTRILLIPPRHWHVLDDFTSTSLCAVFASHPYDPHDYCKDYDEFQASVRR